MNLKKFFSALFEGLGAIENQVKYSFRFTQGEINDILQSAKKENLPFLQELSKINKLSAFEIGFLLNASSLSHDKIATIKAAVEMFDEDEFRAVGQTLSDFIFRVSANLDALNESNLELFKELVQCKNELYDFKEALKRPMRYVKIRKKQQAFAFEKVLM